MDDKTAVASPPSTAEPAKLGLLALMPLILTQQTIGALCFPIGVYSLKIIEPFTFAFYRFVLSSIVLLLLVRFTNHAVPVERKDYLRIFGLGLLIIPLNQTLYLWGQSLTAAGHGSVLFATTPIWVFVFALFILKEKLLWRRVVGIIIALAGVATIMTSGAVQVGTEYLFGDLIIFCSVLAWAMYTILGKPLAEKYGALRMTAYALASGTAVYFPFGLIRAMQYDYSQSTLGAWMSVVYFAVATSVIGYVIWYYVLKHMPASRMAVFSNIQPVIATTVAYFTLGESLGLSFFVGAAVVLTGVLITEL
ncbi:MAG: DMT family transporter [bacterium]|nr:DMT family transporter [bacterium]